ncbi:molecular chaperone DnaJ [Anaeromyxobacter terrae]|uniref:molecular chaperone DnaJ n=1 Tax=Anaeromyxobacter terrae TaxID=2925406 RepID=UPI001F568335|nr:molecular chaperone DnaJ [Anaeromyxobacter sp. SG22]
MEGETCRMCGGDGRVGNVFGGSTATCPSCHGSGRRAEASSGFHDVTKTKPSHHRPAPAVSTGPKVPATSEGVQLAQEVNASTVLAADAKTRLIAEIVNHESTHGRCTKTFIKKVRKQARPAGG